MLDKGINCNRNLLSHIVIASLLAFATVCYAATPCPPLSILPGTILNCHLPSENRTINCLDEDATIPKGTVGNYKCVNDENYGEAFVKCKCRGKWRGLRDFNNFMSTCNMSNYTVDGPPELNLTQKEIDQLATFRLSDTLETFSAQDFQEDGAAYHNLYRKIHHSPGLKLNKTLCDAAQKWADQEVNQSTLTTEPWANRSYSQNIYRFTGNTVDMREAVRLAVAAWYQGAYTYNWETPTGPSGFTQVVWKSTSDLGIGVAHQGNRTVVVANYWPPGNVVAAADGENVDRWAFFRDNVLPLNNVTSESPPSATTTTVVAATTEGQTDKPVGARA